MGLSFLIKLDPRTKLLIVITFTTLAVLITSPIILALLWMFSVGILKMFNISLIQLINKYRKFIPLLISLMIIQSVFAPSGKTILDVIGIRVLTTGGICTAVSIVFRMAILISSAALLSTENPGKLIAGLTAWKMPYEIAFMVFLGIKFLPILAEEMKDSVIAIQLAGADIKHIPLKKKLSIYTYIFFPVVAATILRAKKISISMEARGFRAYPSRTTYHELSLNTIDIIIMTGCMAFGILVYILALNYKI
jgi:energy-coupling factor transport system permease protein